MVMSRQNGLGDGVMALIPLWDLMNHDTALPPSTAFHTDTESLVFTCPVDVATGSEVCTLACVMFAAVMACVVPLVNR